jgi:MFS family permease
VLGELGRLPRVMQLLVLTQLAFNVGFLMVVPYLAVHLVDDLGLASGAVGLVLGLRTFSQQGLFVIGGTLTDRFGAKPVILERRGLRAWRDQFNEVVALAGQRILAGVHPHAQGAARQWSIVPL